ncbi:unannotated protein [freshwater metagenome]|uniref:Unannotated protein n=1 Tax=freshwater metagenome TaxID=449393 RepID=A0A6J6XP93_9ZZZZ
MALALLICQLWSRDEFLGSGVAYGSCVRLVVQPASAAIAVGGSVTPIGCCYRGQKMVGTH